MVGDEEIHFLRDTVVVTVLHQCNIVGLEFAGLLRTAFDRVRPSILHIHYMVASRRDFITSAGIRNRRACARFFAVAFILHRQEYNFDEPSKCGH
jgi:hypothetical protein